MKNTINFIDIASKEFEEPRDYPTNLLAFYNTHLTKTAGPDFIKFATNYQRNPVWKEKEHQQKLMMSIIKGIPIGTIILNKNSNTGQYDCLDGQQRSNTIKLFMEDHFGIPILEKKKTITYSELKELSKMNPPQSGTKESIEILSRIEKHQLRCVYHKDLSTLEQSAIFDATNGGMPLNGEEKYFATNFYLKQLLIYLKAEFKQFHSLSTYHNNNRGKDLKEILILLYCISNSDFKIQIDFNRLNAIKDTDIKSFGRQVNDVIKAYCSAKSLSFDKDKDVESFFIYKNCLKQLKKAITFFNTLTGASIMEGSVKNKGYSWYISLYFSLFIYDKMLSKEHLEKHKKDLAKIFSAYIKWVTTDASGNKDKTYSKIRYPMNASTFIENSKILNDEYTKLFGNKCYMPRDNPTESQKEKALTRFKNNNSLCEECNQLVDLQKDKFDYDHTIPVDSLRDPSIETEFRIIHRHCNQDRANVAV